MGNKVLTACGCKEKEKIDENIEDFGESERNIKSSKSKKHNPGVTDAETADKQDSLKSSESKHIKINDDLTYIGSIANNRKNGKGIIKKTDGSIIYEGGFKDDLFHGDGTMIYDERNIYNGQFLNGKKNGKGFLFSLDQTHKYSGYFKEDMKSGDGTELYPDGSKYIGEYFNDKKDGKGIFHMKDGSIYKGEFKEDNFDGYGRMTWKSDKIFDGEWKESLMHGFGYCYSKGKFHVGYYESGRKDGIGFYFLQNKNIMIGRFSKGKIEGLAIIIISTGEEHLVFMEKGNIKVHAKETVMKDNIKLSTEYKEYKKFYEKHKDIIKKPLQ